MADVLLVGNGIAAETGVNTWPTLLKNELRADFYSTLMVQVSGTRLFVSALVFCKVSHSS